MPGTEVTNTSAPRWLILACFAAVYIIWGSTYLGIKYAIETLPPFLMAGVRFIIAGGILYGWSFLRKEPAATMNQWKSSAIIGALLLLLGNGVVVWAEHFIDSSTAALLITLEPIWVIVLLWLFQNKKPSFVLLLAMIIGMVGMVLLTGITESTGVAKIDIRGVIGISFSTLAWALGSLYSVKADIPSSPIQSTALQMLCGGFMLFAVGIIGGETSMIHPENFSFNSILAFLYLTIVGSVVGYTAYSFLLKHAHPNHVSTYAYVNPVIAIYLGWALANERITTQTIIASVLLVAAVAIITKFSKK